MQLGLTIFGRRFELQTKAIPLQPISGRGGWLPLIREPYPGAWQRNDEVSTDTVLTSSAVFACTTLIASDVAKLNLRLVAKDANGIWTETESPAFSPVLRKPNHFQTRGKFIESWIVSKLVHGNAYVLKQRDSRRLVTAMYVLDPTRVTPLVATNGDVYYELKRDDLSRLSKEEVVVVPASEIIHDTMICLYHPLIGVSPIYASGLAAMQELSIQSNSNRVFSNGSMPGGVLTSPNEITDSTAARLKEYWDTNFSGENVGKVAVLGQGLHFERMAYSSVDLQLIDQLKWTGERVCSCFHVPAYMVGIGPPPPYANVEPLLQQYYSQCIQGLLTTLEAHLDEGMELPKPYGTEFDIDDLIWMDTATKTKAAADSVGSGAMSPNEARRKYFGLGPVPGGDSCYMQNQNFSLEALAKRDAREDPFATAAGPDVNDEDEVDDVDDDENDEDQDEELQAAFFSDVLQKTLAGLTDAP